MVIQRNETKKNQILNMYTERTVDKFKSISNKVQNKTMKTKWKANKKLKHNLVLMAV